MIYIATYIKLLKLYLQANAKRKRILQIKSRIVSANMI